MDHPNAFLFHKYTPVALETDRLKLIKIATYLNKAI